MRFRHISVAFILGLLAFFAYRAAAAPGMLPGDAGEFQFTIPNLGLSHPTGYPLYHLTGWLWGLLFRQNPAQGANQFSALWGGVAVGVFYLACYLAIEQLTTHMKWPWGAGWLAGFAAMLFALNPVLWSQAIQAEVYTLLAVFFAGILAAALRVGSRTERRGGRWWASSLAVLTLLVGLALTHHLTILLLLPAVFIYLLLTRPDAFAPIGLVRLAPFLLIPLLLYLYVPLRASASPWLTVHLSPTWMLDLFDESLRGIIRYILGVGFAPALRTPAEALSQIPFAAALFLQVYGWLGIALIILGFAALVLEEQFPVLILTVISFVLLQVFNLFYGIEDIIAFYIPLFLIAAIWLTAGLAYLIDVITRLTTTALRPYLLALGLIALLIPALHWRDYVDTLNRSQDNATAVRWATILSQDLPADGILVSNDRDEITPLLYKQNVEGLAPGMTGLFPLISNEPEWQDLNTTLTAALETGRPVHIIKPMPGIEAHFLAEPIGGEMAEITGVVPAPETSFEYPYGEYLRWLNIDWSGEPEPGGELDVSLFWRVTQEPPVNWHSFLQLTDASGEKAAQADDHRPGGIFLPATLWHPGDVIRDEFVLALPAELTPGEYNLVTGFYDPETGQRMAEPLVVAAVVVR
ncbi:MAG: DUF2723 domain-containing protein [Caldilineales bacterium]|nr:DUF2723 domain-containing protein [Caldilineales bacterium]